MYLPLTTTCIVVLTIGCVELHVYCPSSSSFTTFVMIISPLLLPQDSLSFLLPIFGLKPSPPRMLYRRLTSGGPFHSGYVLKLHGRVTVKPTEV